MEKIKIVEELKIDALRKLYIKIRKLKVEDIYEEDIDEILKDIEILGRVWKDEIKNLK